ncbi:transposase [Bradyrhizobium sp. IC3069]|nr:transposase [Bradyrhizobium sp. IC4059]MCA1521061.1 transposase [Bradyrhizobium sp. IC3069]
MLHTSGSAMNHHPRIHMIVPGGIDGKFNIVEIWKA